MTEKDRSKFYVDENVVRLIAAQVVILAVVAQWQSWPAIFIFLSVDFALRGLTRFPAPLAVAAKAIAIAFKLSPHPIFAPPKRFAAKLGFLFSVVISILFLLHYTIVAFIAGSVLVLFAILESAFRICIGCRIYDWFIAPISNRKHSDITELA